MKDLDFDELDRAVNSLVGGVPATPAPDATPPVPATTPVATNPTLSATPEPTLPPSTVPTVPADQALAARRNSGRFMDVVHPSSDMRSNTPVAAITPISRTGATIQPDATPNATEPTSNPVSAEASKPEPTTPTIPAKAPAEWPDPLDFHGVTPEQASTAPAPQPIDGSKAADDNDITKIADDIHATLSKDMSAPLESPFIPDAKVEKRPLGAFSTDVSLSAPNMVTQPDVPTKESTPELSPASTSVVPQAENTDEHPIETDTPLPAELQTDLLTIESNETSVTSAPEAQFTPPATPSTDTPTGPTSIVQQYKEMASTGDQPAPVLFDSAAYKKPQTKQKKKSSWLVVLWIFLLLVVGGGIGAAVYFFVLPIL